MSTFKHHITKITLTVLFVVFVGLLVLYTRPVGSTFANHSGDNGLQLTIDSYTIYNDEFQENLSWELKDLVPGVDRFFNFGDVKPGDTGTNVISLHVEGSDAYICMDFTKLVDVENDHTEPESLVDEDLFGELSDAVEFFSWRDDGDNVYEVGEKALFGTSTQAAVDVLSTTTYPLADANSEEVFEAGETYWVGIAWCAGDLEVNEATAEITCDATAMGNEYQTDSFSVDVSLRAVEVASFTDYTCDARVNLYLNKQISGEDLGYELSDFNYRITGEAVDIIAPHDSFTKLEVGTYTIEELVPEGFVKEDWRIGWYGQCESGNAFSTTIVIEPRHIDWGTLYCEADNQYRPDSDNTPDEPAEESTEEVVEEEPETDSEDTQQWTREERDSRTLLDRTRSR